MIPLGIAPGIQGGLPGTGKIWSPRKRTISQQEKEEQMKKEKFTSLFRRTGKRSSVTKTTGGAGAPTNKKNRSERKQSRRTPDKGWRAQTNTTNKTYTLIYTKEEKVVKSKEKKQRETQGEIPTSSTSKGNISTIFGHSVEKIDNRSTFRAIFQNPNGINPHESNYSFLLSLT